MYKIAICDDDKLICDELNQIIKNYFTEIHESYQISIFHTAKDFLVYFNKEKFDFIFLDIDIGDDTGIHIAKRVRETMPFVKVVFITSYIEYQQEAFSLHSFDYILKPFHEIQINKVLHDLIYWSKNENNNKKKYEFKTKIAGLISLDEDEICFIEYLDRKVYIFIKDEILELIYGTSMQDVANILKDNNNFISPHRAFIINLNQVKLYVGLERKMIMKNGKTIPISKLKATEVKNAYLKKVKEF